MDITAPSDLVLAKIAEEHPQIVAAATLAVAYEKAVEERDALADIVTALALGPEGGDVPDRAYHERAMPRPTVVTP